MFGALVYGASNFGLLIVLNRSLGQRSAGVVVVAIAVFQIVSTVAGMGCSTGLVRIISRDRATGHPERLPAVVAVGVVPVVVASVLVTIGMWASAGWLSEVFARGVEAHRVADVLRAMSLLLPAATLHTVLVQGTRGFDTMLPLVAIERVGRAISLPLVVGVAAALDFGPRGVGVAWAATNVVALLFSARALRWRVRKAVRDVTPVPASRAIAADFWSFTGPRAVGQASEVAVNWLDTVLVGALVSTTAAGIYASGTRYLLPGMFAAEALMQVTAPRISGLLARHQAAEASELLRVVAGWQVVVMWPLYLVTAFFPRPLLEVFGPQVVQARGALIALSVAMLAASPLGPAGSAILMSGRSRQAMFNTLVFLGVNLGGNLIFLPRYGITAAGLVWAATILVAALLPNWQARRTLGVSTLGRPAFVAAALAAGTIGVVAVAARVVVGDDTVGLLATSSVGGVAYLVGLRSLRGQLHLDALWDGFRRRSSPGSVSNDPAPSTTPGTTR
jgi:O-antigen/teichoic acid export membrane protein